MSVQTRSKSTIPSAFKKPAGGGKRKSPMKAFPGDKAAERAFAFGKSKEGSFPANSVPAGAFGDVDKARVAKLKADPKRPKPLKRKSVAKLPKVERKKIVEARKVAKTKYTERSASFKKDRVYLKNRLKKMQNHTARKMSEWAERLHASKTHPLAAEKKKPNFTLIYSVGPQHEERRKSFREFRVKKYMELKKGGKKGGDPVLAMKLPCKLNSRPVSKSKSSKSKSKSMKHASPEKKAAQKDVDKAKKEIEDAKEKFNKAQEKLGEAQKKLCDAKRALVTAR